MIKKLLLYLRRRFLAYRLSLIQRERNQLFECTLEHVLQLAMVSDDVLCQNYQYTQGEKVTIFVKAKKATELTNWLFYVVERVKAGSYLEDQHLFPSYGKWRPTIDEFLVNDNGGSVTLLEYQVALRNSIVALFDAIEACPDTSLQPYYLRRASAVFQDLYAVQEGMIYASLIEL